MRVYVHMRDTTLSKLIDDILSPHPSKVRVLMMSHQVLLTSTSIFIQSIRAITSVSIGFDAELAVERDVILRMLTLCTRTHLLAQIFLFLSGHVFCSYHTLFLRG
jgi:hypothetical protein